MSLERQWNPHLKYSEAVFREAYDGYWYSHREMTGHYVFYKNEQPWSGIRDEVSNFGATWETAASQSKHSEQLALLTLVQGHPGDTGLQWGPIGSLLASTVILDLICVYSTVALLNRMSASTQSRNFATWSATLFGVVILIFAVSSICSTYFLHGSPWI